MKRRWFPLLIALLLVLALLGPRGGTTVAGPLSKGPIAPIKLKAATLAPGLAADSALALAERHAPEVLAAQAEGQAAAVEALTDKRRG